MFTYPGDRIHIEKRRAEAAQIRRENIKQMPAARFKAFLLSKLKRIREK